MTKGARAWLRLLTGLMVAMLSFSAAALNCATPGKDGPGGTLNGVINRYWPGTASASAGAASIVLGASSGSGAAIAIGDLLMVIQMQDAAIDRSNDNTYGGGNGLNPASGSTALNSAGLYEYVRATSAAAIGGGAVTVVGGSGAGLLNSYTNADASNTQGQRRFQIVRVPQYTTATLSSGLTAIAWNGSTGGVLVFDVAGQLTLGGATVSVNGLGFRGGAARELTGGPGANTDYRTNAANNNNGSKGEGIAGTPRYVNNLGVLLNTGSEGYPNGSHARGAPGNAGGGGTDGNPVDNKENTGGGGGSNAGGGGKGGNGWRSASPTGGFGGFDYSPFLNPGRMFLGGGGGSGTNNNGTGDRGAGFASSGAAGGGMVMIRASLITGGGTISANGANANNSALNDGSGGGGAGGSVLVYVKTVSSGLLSVQANGGNGGTNAGGSTAPEHGPGGGGSGGYVASSSVMSTSVNFAGGAPGTTAGGSNFGATAGESGSRASLSSTAIPGVRSGAECAVVIVKNFNPDTVTPGGTSTLSVTLTSPNSVPITGIGLNDVFPALPGAMTVAAPLTITNSCSPGVLLDSGGNTLAAADKGIRLNNGSLAANGSCTFSVKVTASELGTYTNVIPVGALVSANGGTNSALVTDILTIVSPPSLVFVKTVSVISDPFNLATNPKNIPGAEVLYTLRVTNTGLVSAGVDSIVIIDPMPANTELFVGDLGVTGSGPIAFVQGTPGSGLTWKADDATFSKSDCSTFGYAPVPAAQYDLAVKCIRLNPKGTLAAASGGANPFFELRFRVRLK